MFKIVLIGLALCTGIIYADNEAPLPVVLWHGMGDTCCFPFSLGAVEKLIKTEIPGIHVKSIEIGGNIIIDYESGFFIHPNDQMNYVCRMLANETQLAHGYNAIGFSQGGQFLRALVQRCPHPPMKTLISLGGQHQGVFGLPKCPSLKKSTCERIRKLLNHSAYNEWVQAHLVQATFWHDPLNEGDYRSQSTFLSDINNELIINDHYVENLNNLERFVMVKFLNDTIVQPLESQWFEFYAPGQDKIILPLPQSDVYRNLGLNRMHTAGKLQFLAKEGDHLEINKAWFVEKLIPLLRGK